MLQKGTVYFFTGLSGAGKTTLGQEFCRNLREQGKTVVFLDGDMTRPVFCEDIGYSGEDRLRGSYRTFRIARMLAEQGLDVVCCYIAMYEEVRRWNRENIPNYREIYVKVTRETLLKRNKKGLYTGKKNVVGVDLPFDEPKNPDFVIENDGQLAPAQIAQELSAQFLSQE